MATKKFSPMRFTAATEEAALEGALALVGAARDEADYEVLSQSAKGVTVRVRPRDENALPAEPETIPEPAEDEAPLHLDSVDDFDAENDFEDDFEIIALDTQEEGEDLVKDEVDSDEVDSDEVDSDEVDSDELDSDEVDSDEVDSDELDYDAELEIDSDEYDAEDDETEDEIEEIEPAPAREIDSETRERALTLAGTFLEKLGLDADVTPGDYEGGDTVPLIIEGEDVGILIGKHGATLQSFQYLLNLTLNNARDSEEGVRVTVDAGNYRARRQSSLEAVARGAAQRARREGGPIRLEPMPANERRIVHNFLQSEPGIVTQSEGREPHRCVVVAPGRNTGNGGGNRGGRGMGGYTRGRGGRGRR